MCAHKVAFTQSNKKREREREKETKQFYIGTYVNAMVKALYCISLALFIAGRFAVDIRNVASAYDFVLLQSSKHRIRCIESAHNDDFIPTNRNDKDADKIQNNTQDYLMHLLLLLLKKETVSIAISLSFSPLS